MKVIPDDQVIQIGEEVLRASLNALDGPIQNDLLLRRSGLSDMANSLGPISTKLRPGSQVSNTQLGNTTQDCLTPTGKGFAVYEDRDKSQDNLIQYLDKVGSINFNIRSKNDKKERVESHEN